MRVEPVKKIKVKREYPWLKKAQYALAIFLVFASVFVFFFKILFF